MNTNKIDLETNLISIAMNIDSIDFLLLDLQEDYFFKFNPDNNKDVLLLLSQFPAVRAKLNSISILVLDIKKQLMEINVKAYQ